MKVKWFLKSVLLFIFWIICFKQIFAQEPDTLWTKTFGGNLTDEGHDVQEISDGGFIVTGLTESFGAGNSDIWLIKTNSQGLQQWAKTIGGGFSENGNSIQQTNDEGFIIAGYQSTTNSVEGRDFWLIKTDSMGDTLWTRRYGLNNDRDEAYSVVQTTDGGYILTGFTGWVITGHSDMLLIKTDQNGDTLWTLTYGGQFFDDGSSVAETDDGNFIVAGSTTSEFDTTIQAYLMKVNSSGDTLWTQKYGSQGITRGIFASQTDDQGYILGGDTDQDAWLLKADSLGNELWSLIFTEPNSEFINNVHQTRDGGYIATMWLNDGGSGNFGRVIKTDSIGNVEWMKTYPSLAGALKVFYSVKETSDLGYVLTGVTDNDINPPQFDLWLVRFEGTEVIADFTADTLSGQLPLEVHFTDLSSLSVTSWYWDFNNDDIIGA